MKKILFIATMLFATIANLFATALPQKKTCPNSKPVDFYSLEATSLAGNLVKMCDYKGKYILIVNTASNCGFTPQFEGLEELYKKYKNQGLVILGFPCNQFGKQEPGDEESIAAGCVVNYGVTFPMFSKIEVNGENTHPIYNYLKSQQAGSIKWNFTKFLVSPKGEVIERFGSRKSPSEIGNILKGLL